MVQNNYKISILVLLNFCMSQTLRVLGIFCSVFNTKVEMIWTWGHTHLMQHFHKILER